MCYNKNMKRSFTLIELLIVVLIVGILATVALPRYTKVIEKVRLTEAVVMVKALADAMELYYIESGKWPSQYQDAELLIGVPDSERWTFDCADLVYLNLQIAQARVKDFVYGQPNPNYLGYSQIAVGFNKSDPESDNFARKYLGYVDAAMAWYDLGEGWGF